jgi:hypothetical protein
MNTVSCFFLAYGQYCCPDCDFNSTRKLDVLKHLKAAHLPTFNRILNVQRERKNNQTQQNEDFSEDTGEQILDAAMNNISGVMT